MSNKYIGMDVYQASTVIVVLNEAGKTIMETILETKTGTLLDFIQGLRGRLQVTFEEGTYAAWLYDVLTPYVERVVVCDPRKNKLLPSGHKSDKVDARKLAEWLRQGQLVAVYHGNRTLRGLKELVRSYLCLVQDVTRVMNRLKALYRGRGISCGGRAVYRLRQRDSWLALLSEPGVQQRAALLYQQLDVLQALRQTARQALVTESRKQAAFPILRQIPGLGPIRAGVVLALVQTPHRFRTKRQFWAYLGLAVVTSSSAEYRIVQGRVQKSGKPVSTRGLNPNYNRALKDVFKAAATGVSQREGPFKTLYARWLDRGLAPELARLSLARKLAALTLTLWKKGARYHPEQVTQQAA